MIDSINYHNHTARASKSQLDAIGITPAHYYCYYLDDRYQKDENEKFSLFFGEAFHCAVLEPHLFFDRYLVLPVKCDRRTREGKQMWNTYMDAGEGKKLLNPDVYDEIMWMKESVDAKEICKTLLAGGLAEEIVTFTEPKTGAPCKMKLDWLTPDEIIVDLKTAEDASPAGFRKAVAKYDLNVQNAFYSDGFFHANRRRPKAFIFVAVEKKPPYAVGIYALSEMFIQEGRDKYLERLRTWQSCMESGEWPAYSNQIITLQSYSENL